MKYKFHGYDRNNPPIEWNDDGMIRLKHAEKGPLIINLQYTIYPEKDETVDDFIKELEKNVIEMCEKSKVQAKQNKVSQPPLPRGRGLPVEGDKIRLYNFEEENSPLHDLLKYVEERLENISVSDILIVKAMIDEMWKCETCEQCVKVDHLGIQCKRYGHVPVGLACNRWELKK